MNKLLAKSLASLDTATVAVTDYELLNAGSARVVVRCSGNMSQDKFAEKLQAKLKNTASPLEGSFRWTDDSKRVAIGYVVQTPEIRDVSKDELKAKYKVVSATANIFMDPEDESCWELSTGAGGSYLRRSQSETLPAVLSSVKSSSGTSAERMFASGSVAAFKTTPSNGVFVSMVLPQDDSAVIDYGSIVGFNSKDNTYAVFSNNLRTKISVDAAQLIHAVEYSRNEMMPVTASLPDVSTVIEYYKKAYPHGEASGYLDKLMDVIAQQAAA